MRLALLVITLGIMSNPAWCDLPADPFQRTAAKALNGEFGKIPKWKVDLYRKGQQQKVQFSKKVWLTCYYGTESSGRIDSHSNPCTTKTAAANEIPQFAWIWSPETSFRQILDTGAKSNDHLARNPQRSHKGRLKWQPADCWADIWYPNSRCPKNFQSGQTYRFAVIP